MVLLLLLFLVSTTLVLTPSPAATTTISGGSHTTTINLLLLRFLHATAATAAAAAENNRSSLHFSFPSFSQSNADVFNFSADSSGILAGALQVTFDRGTQSVAVANSSGQITYGTPLLLWDPAYNYTASFNTSFLINMGPPTQDGGDTDVVSGGGGMAFFVSPDPATHLPGSSSASLGLPDSPSTSRFVAVEFDTFRDSIDNDNNHLGLDINTTMSNLTQPLDSKGITTLVGTNTSVWIDYDGQSHTLHVYLAQNGPVLGNKPSIFAFNVSAIDLRQYLPQNVYFGFSASTGTLKETRSVLTWDFSYVGFPTSGTPTPTPTPTPNPNPTPTPNPNPNPKPAGSPSPSSSNAVHGIALGLGLLVAALLVAALIIFIVLRRRKQRQENLLQDLASLNYGPRRFEFTALKKATKGFSAECKLGQGGFGAVYRGQLGSGDGSIQVAVKCLSQNSSQGQKEFRAEIKSMGRMRHKNLVQLLGWSFDRWKGRPLLVYEYMPNGSLDRWLHPRRRGEDSADGSDLVMDWNRRLHVLKGVAAGLLYLHEEWEMVVVHRDLKPSNIMLDSEFNARLGDFGLARLIKSPVEGTQGSEQDYSTQTFTIAGTPGYMAPECIEAGVITKESDVYSFGAVAMELATGKRLSAENLHWLWQLYAEGRLQDAGKENGLAAYDEKQMELVLNMVFACCHPQPASRPTMRHIVHVLSSFLSSSSSAVVDPSISFTPPVSSSFLSGPTFDSVVSYRPDSVTSSPSSYLLSSSSTTITMYERAR